MDRNELLERVAFGQNVQAFWDSQVGAYLRSRATEVYTAAIRELKTVNPTDTGRITQLQADIFKAEGFVDWLSEAITDGLKALDLIEGDDDNVD